MKLKFLLLSIQECTQKSQDLENENKKLTNDIVKMEKELKVLHFVCWHEPVKLILRLNWLLVFFIYQNETETKEYIKHEANEVRQQNDDLEHDVEILVNLVGNVMAGRKIEVRAGLSHSAIIS